jgi:hypothetical protein
VGGPHEQPPDQSDAAAPKAAGTGACHTSWTARVSLTVRPHQVLLECSGPRTGRRRPAATHVPFQPPPLFTRERRNKKKRNPTNISPIVRSPKEQGAVGSYLAPSSRGTPSPSPPLPSQLAARARSLRGEKPYLQRRLQWAPPSPPLGPLALARCPRGGRRPN